MAEKRLRFGDAGDVKWNGPWPPPEEMVMAIGRQTGLVSITQRSLMEEQGVTMDELRDHAVVHVYKLVDYSKLPDDDSDVFVIRGAMYELSEILDPLHA